ncbi:ABC transporter ATP-binding protein [Anoxynatronum buryatiense]|uniref:ABC-type quaternary amine transporter n=1 Tax=Anoxynatronum buryatiense TaxID=489973 RepID=A0AA45WZ31_9CLOT|nr:ABC transporter ATP-binding protein [Anoxynatronum buryatiense]SMP66327.1 iron(III) transport system ATP-binding protein [Anoxynatronum buryatiense]
MLELVNVSKKLDRQSIIQSVSFRTPKGCFHTILGDSGTGKTTLLKLIAGLEKPEEGHILLEGRDVTAVPAEGRRIPMIFQQPLLFPHLTVYQNIAFGLETAGWNKGKIRNQVQALLAVLQISELELRIPGTLSGGQQQRVSIARALAPGNPLVLMDEPFSSLDPSLRRELGQQVKTLQRQMNLTVIFVTHDVTEALQLSDEILLLKEGKVLESGTPQELYERPKKMATARFMEAGNLVEGSVVKGEFHCELGCFLSVGIPEGPATGLIPERGICVTSGDGDARIIDIRYLGKSRRVKVLVGDISLWIEGDFQCDLSIGQTVEIRLPEQIHLMYS